jgi:pSer/pThr/pTyr-binding forkhead associated (FHA) protein
MAKLVLSTNGTILDQCFIAKDRTTIGRDADSDLVIDDPVVSRAHAAIITVGNDQTVEDLGAANGTLVNGKRITRHLLEPAI